MTLNEINDIFLKDYVATSGLCRLDPGDTDISPSGVETPHNDNSILFLCYYLLLAEMAKVDISGYRNKVNLTILSLERKPYFGIFNRQPHGDVKPTIYEAHDNYAAICALSVIFELIYPRSICSYGERNGWNYNNVDPDVFMLQQQRQGGEVAFYKTCAGQVPAIWEWIWLMGGFVLNAFKGDGGESMLAWIRILTMSKLMDKMTTYQRIGFGLVKALWVYKYKKHYGNLSTCFRGYFMDKNHPINLMADKVEGII